MAKIYASIIKTGLEKLPIIIIEEIYTYEEGYDNIINKIYKQILQNAKFEIFNNIIVIYNKEGISNIKRYEIKVKQEFLDIIQDRIFIELHLWVIDAFEKPIEQYFLKCFLYKNTITEEVIETNRPLFNIKDKEKNNKNVTFYGKIEANENKYTEI